jgi:hypothetical protein
MAWGLFLAVSWGVAATLAWSHIARPGRVWLIDGLEALERKLVPSSFRKKGGAFLSKGPGCPACVSFWVAVALTQGGWGPPGAQWWQSAFAAYGLVLVLSALLERLAPPGW